VGNNPVRFIDPSGGSRTGVDPELQIATTEPSGLVLGKLAHTIIQFDYGLRHPTASPEVTYFNSATQEAGRVD